MAFQTGTATDLDDLIDKIRLFASANGWTVNKYVAPSAGFDSELYLQKGSLYASIDANSTNAPQTYHSVFQTILQPWLYLYAATGFDTGATVDSQPVFSPAVKTAWLLGPMTAYYFFADLNYFHVVVETIPGEFQHFGWGEVSKIGTYTGGFYAYGTIWDQSGIFIDVPASFRHTTPFDGISNQAANASVLGTDVDTTFQWKTWSTGVVTSSRCIPVGRNGILDDLTTLGPNQFNALTPLQPMPAGHGMSGDLYSIVGHILDIRNVNIQAIAPGDTQSIGGDIWYVFPTQTKNDPNIRDDLPNSGYYGFAYKKVP